MNKRKIIAYIFLVSTILIIVEIILTLLQTSWGPGTTFPMQLRLVFSENLYGQIILVIALMSGLYDVIPRLRNFLT